MMRRTAPVVLLACMLGCSGDDGANSSAATRVEAGLTADADGKIVQVQQSESAADAAPVDPLVLQQQLAAHVDSVDRKLRRVPALTAAEKKALRRDVNAVQIARARMLGVRVQGAVEPVARSGRLVRLADSSPYWVVRDLDYSMPYVTPGTEAMLMEVGRRFHARLDSLGVPRYRLDITSVLRTPEKQAALRRANRNASKVESAHEFGTTVDIAYRRFAPPAEAPQSGLAGDARLLADSMMIETARLRGAELQAVLGRVLREMQSEGKVMVMMERQQTVYHITVARRFPPAARAGSL